VVAVTLYTNGTSLVTYEARVAGSGSLELPVPGEDMLDILKTLVVRDLDGGTISSAGFTAKDPVSRTLSRLSVDLSGNPGIRDLLVRGRGMDVRISFADSSVSGRILGLENRSSPGGSGEHVNMLVRGQIRSIPVSSITSFSYIDDDARQDLDSALDLVREASSSERKSISIEYRGEGNRRILISYLRPAPVWKPSYRMISGDSGSVIQGWAIVENTGSGDWNDIALSLSTADPVSFVMDLYTPRYVTRPTLSPPGLSSAPVPAPIASAPPSSSGLEAQSYARSAAPSAMAEESMAFDYYAQYDDFESVAESTPSRATGTISGALAQVFEYRLDEPVSLEAQNSAMVPIINAELDVDSYLTWRSDGQRLVYGPWISTIPASTSFPPVLLRSTMKGASPARPSWDSSLPAATSASSTPWKTP
jgi:hypothetical protein